MQLHSFVVLCSAGIIRYLFPPSLPFKFQRKDSDWPNTTSCFGQIEHTEQYLHGHPTSGLWQVPPPNLVGDLRLFKACFPMGQEAAVGGFGDLIKSPNLIWWLG